MKHRDAFLLGDPQSDLNQWPAMDSLLVAPELAHLAVLAIQIGVGDVIDACGREKRSKPGSRGTSTKMVKCWGAPWIKSRSLMATPASFRHSRCRKTNWCAFTLTRIWSRKHFVL